MSVRLCVSVCVCVCVCVWRSWITPRVFNGAPSGLAHNMLHSGIHLLIRHYKPDTKNSTIFMSISGSICRGGMENPGNVISSVRTIQLPADIPDTDTSAAEHRPIQYWYKYYHKGTKFHLFYLFNTMAYARINNLQFKIASWLFWLLTF
jgi:hypothetical protein